MRYLRNQLNCSQQRVADGLMITRGRYAKYEDSASEPPIELLIRISRYFHVSIDLLVSVDLRRYPLQEIIELPDNRILLPVQVDTKGSNQIEIIPHKTTMGYLTGYNDPEYIESLQTISLPFLGPGKYRAFPAEGDSMPPHTDNTYIVGRYMENPAGLKKGKGYVFVTRDGFTYKKFSGRVDDRLKVVADNDFYEPYEIPLQDILQIWQYACSIATTEFTKEDFNVDNQVVLGMFRELKNEIAALKGKVGK